MFPLSFYGAEMCKAAEWRIDAYGQTGVWQENMDG